MSQPSYVKHTGTGPMPEELFRGLPEIPASLSENDDVKAARLRMTNLFSQFNFINKHEAQIAAKIGDSTFKLSAGTRRSWANKIRRQVGPSIVLNGFFAGARALELVTEDNKSEVIKDFIAPLQEVIKSFLENEAIKDLLRPYSLGIAAQNAIRTPIKAAALPPFQAALRTNKFGLECSFDEIIQKDDLVESLNLAHLQWTTISNFKAWVDTTASENFSMVTLDVLQKHVVLIESCLKHIANLKHENQSN